MNKAIPFDLHYKALIEYLFEEDVIVGFRVYWPNGNQSQCTNRKDGSYALNIYWDPDGSVNFQVGLYAPESNRSEFLRLWRLVSNRSTRQPKGEPFVLTGRKT